MPWWPKFIQPRHEKSRMMNRRLLILCLSHAFTGVRSQPPQKPVAVFTPPAVHDISRYERTLSGNPFMLPTAPEPAATISPLADWSLASVYGPSAGPTVAVVNMKTHERVRLQAGSTASNGMRLITARFGAAQKDARAVVELAGARHELRFNLEWLRQTAAAGGGQRLPPSGRVITGAKVAGVVPSSQAGTVRASAPALAGDPARITGPIAGGLPQGASPLFAAAAAGPGFQLEASDPATSPPDMADTSGTSSGADVWTQLESVVPIPLRRHPLRPAAFEPHPDPQ